MENLAVGGKLFILGVIIANIREGKNKTIALNFCVYVQARKGPMRGALDRPPYTVNLK